MEMAYKFIVFVVILILLILLWIPLSYGASEVNDSLNGMLNASDPEQQTAIDNNNTAFAVFYWTLFVFILAMGIYVIKPEQSEGVVYA